MDPVVVHGIVLGVALVIIAVLGVAYMETEKGWKKWVGVASILYIIAALTTLIIFGGG